MAYRKVLDGPYILGVGFSQVGNIEQAEYEEIVAQYVRKPTAPVGYAYMLRDDTNVWELVKQPDPRKHNIIGTKWIYRNKRDEMALW